MTTISTRALSGTWHRAVFLGAVGLVAVVGCSSNDSNDQPAVDSGTTLDSATDARAVVDVVQDKSSINNRVPMCTPVKCAVNVPFDPIMCRCLGPTADEDASAGDALTDGVVGDAVSEGEDGSDAGDGATADAVDDADAGSEDEDAASAVDGSDAEVADAGAGANDAAEDAPEASAADGDSQ